MMHFLILLSSAGADPGIPYMACDSAVSGVVINEFMADPAGSDSDREWIELHNTTENSVDLSGWKIQGGSSSFSSIGTFPQGASISAGGYILVGDSAVASDLGQVPDHIFNMTLGNAGSNSDAIRVVDCESNVIDTVIYGEPVNNDNWIDDTGSSPVSYAPKPRSGQTIGRMPNGVDTDTSSLDFSVLDFATPWSSNEGNGVCHGQNVVKINEFLANPDSDDELKEWVELHNSSSDSVNLQGWTIQWGTSSFSSEFVMPSVSIPANGYLLLGGEAVSDTDVVVPANSDLAMGSGSSNADAIRLLHCGPGVADTVIYGPSDDGVGDNTDGWEDDDGIVATSISPKPISGMSLSRRQNGVDTDDNGLDFVVSLENTPGEPNPEVQCEEGNLEVKINEIYPNPSGTDGGNEWIELYNSGSATVRLDDWLLQTASSSWSDKFTFPPETSIGPGEFFLLGEENIPSEMADLISSSNLSLGTASTGLDGVRLIDCPGTVQDTFLYGKQGAVPDPDEVEFRDDQGAVSSGVMPSSGLSVGRFPDGADSDENSVDFQTDMDPSPGFENEQGSLSTDTGGGEVPGKGCGKSPDSSDGPSKCSAVRGVPGGVWAVFLFVLWRRRQV